MASVALCALALLVAAAAATPPAATPLHLFVAGEYRSSTNTGMTGDFCLNDRACAGDRNCITVGKLGTGAKCDSSSYACSCYARAACAGAPGACVAGETCVRLSETVTQCLSCQLAHAALGSQFVGANECDAEATEEPSASPEASPEPASGETGLSGEFCLSSSECQGPRRCFDGDDECTPDSQGCTCWARIPCSSSNPCVVGEACMSYKGNAEPFCLSCWRAVGVNDLYFVGPELCVGVVGYDV